MTENKQPLKEFKEAGQAEKVPRRKQWYRSYYFQIILLLTMISFGVLTYFASNIAYFEIDLRITLGLQQITLPIVKNLMHWVSWAGYFPQSIILTLLILFLFDSFGFRWEAAVGLITAAFDISLNTLLKLLIHRPRPAADLVNVMKELTNYSFPSGHVMFYVGFFGLIWFLIFSLLKNSWKRTILLVLFGSLILLVGVSRIFLGQHWFSDVVGAYLMGGLVLAAAIRLYLWGKTRFFTHQPAAAEPKS